MMYQDFLEGVLTYIKALDAARESLDETKGTVPYLLGDIEVMLDGEVCGYIRDEDGIGFAYFDKPAGPTI